MIIRLILPWLQYMVVYFFAVAHWLFFSILCKHNKPVLEFSLFRIFKKWLNLTYMYSETITPKNSVDLGYSKRMLRLRLNSTFIFYFLPRLHMNIELNFKVLIDRIFIGTYPVWDCFTHVETSHCILTTIVYILLSIAF